MLSTYNLECQFRCKIYKIIKNFHYNNIKYNYIKKYYNIIILLFNTI